MENCSRAISVALCSWTAVLVMNLRTRTRTRPSEASPMMSCCPVLRLHQITRGPLESWQRIMSPQRKKHRRETGAHLSLDHYLLSKWLSAFEDVKRGIVDGALGAWADDEILPPHVASTLRITPHPLDERFPLGPDSPWLLRPNEALTESGHKIQGFQVNRDQLLRLFPKKGPSAAKNSISSERPCTEWLMRAMRPHASGPCVPPDEPKKVWRERAKEQFALFERSKLRSLLGKGALRNGLRLGSTGAQAEIIAPLIEAPINRGGYCRTSPCGIVHASQPTGETLRCKKLLGCPPKGGLQHLRTVRRNRARQDLDLRGNQRGQAQKRSHLWSPSHLED